MSALAWLHPWLLAGLAGASLPVLIHLIGRRRAPVVEFAAFDFLMAVNKRLAKREKLRQILLLILRTLALAALAMAIARPVPARPAAATAQSKRLALVFDASASMGYTLGNKTLFELGKARAKELLSNLQPGDSATLVIAGDETRAAFQAPTVDLAAVRGALDAVEMGHGSSDLGAAIDAALGQWGTGGAGLTLAVVSDLAENGFRNLRPTALDPPPEVRLIDAAGRDEPKALGNLAIEAVSLEAGVTASERRIKVTVHNYGAGAVSGRALELVLGDNVTQRGYVEVPGRGVQEKVFTTTFPEPGVFDGEVRLASSNDDGFRFDDHAFFGGEIVPGVRVLALNGDMRTTPHEDELFFLERALAAVPKGDPPIDLRIIAADELPTVDDLMVFDVVLMANVAALPETEVARLRDFVKKGRGLFIALGDQIRFEPVNERLGDLLPHPLRDLHLAADPAAGTPPLGITGIDWDHPIVAGLGGVIEESLRASRTARYFNLDVGADRKTRSILRYDIGAPALVEARRSDAGRVLLLTTTVDVDMSDLAIRSAFPALVQRSVRYLAKAVGGGPRPAVRQGGTAELALPTGGTGLTLVSPSGRRLTAEGTSGRVRLGGLDEVGLYRAEVQNGGNLIREPRLDAAVSPSLDESDFTPVRTAQVASALGKGDSDVAVAFGADAASDPFALRGFGSLLLLALVCLFVGESLLASRG